MRISPTGVVSHRETWIEIATAPNIRPRLIVVSHRETWIEIYKLAFITFRNGSRLSQRDVDWNVAIFKKHRIMPVVSHRETWIEITSWPNKAAVVLSSLTERRGLKWCLPPIAAGLQSRLSQRDVDWNLWTLLKANTKICRLSQRDVDWNESIAIHNILKQRRLSQRDVDWNRPLRLFGLTNRSRLSQRDVDWN